MNVRANEPFGRVIGLRAPNGDWVLIPARVNGGHPIFTDKEHASRYASTDALRHCTQMRLDGYSVRMTRLY